MLFSAVWPRSLLLLPDRCCRRPPPQVEYKSAFKLRSTEDVFAALEDNIVTLSTMKASKYFVVFEKDLTFWEKTLSLVSETIEIILTVQRNWMYLENIFVGSEDIRKQLPHESIMFDAVHVNFIRTTRELKAVGNVQKACCAAGVLEMFQVRPRRRLACESDVIVIIGAFSTLHYCVGTPLCPDLRRCVFTRLWGNEVAVCVASMPIAQRRTDS